jgi:hypothetical protein
LSLHERSSDASSGDTPPREAPFHYDPAPFEPGVFHADPYDEISTAEKSETDIFTSAPFDSEPLHADAGHTGFDVQEVADIPADVADIQETPDASSESRYTALETAIDPVMQIHENPPRTRAEDIPSKPFTSADIARLDIFDTDVASPFAREPEGADVVSPFDLSDASVASLFGSSAPDWDAAQTSFATSVAQPESEPVPDAEPAAEEPSPDEAPHYHKMDAEAELKQNQKIQEIISQPVIFPFDEETGYVEPEAEGAGDDDPEDESVDSGGEAIREPVTEYSDDQSEPAVDETARKTAAEDGDDQGEYYSDKKADRKAAKEEKKKKKGQHRAGKDDAPDEAGNAQKPPARWLVIMMDILVVIAALVIAAFAFLKLAPDSGVAHILDQGVTKVAELFSGSGSDSADGGSSNDNEEFIAPMPNKDALVSAQAGFNNRNIIEVVYDPNAGYNSNRTYSIQGVSGAKPIENDYWTTDDKGYVLYDEAAVAAVIRFNSELVSYVNGQQSDILSLLETGSKEEAVLNNYAASLTALEFRKLGIGEILTDGTYFYVFTNETAMETRNGIATELNSSKVYKLAADPVVSEMKIVEIETVA